MKKILRSAGLVVLALTAIASPAHSDQKPINLGIIGAVPTTSAEEKLCMRHVHLVLGKQAFEFSRLKNMRYTTVAGKDVSITDPHHPYNDCSVIDGGAVTNFTTGFKKWTDYNINASLPPAKILPGAELSTYTQNKQLIDDAVNGGQAVRVKDDSRKILVGKASAMYLLPKDINTTQNGEPVAVYCTPNPENSKIDPATGKPNDFKTNICSSQYLNADGFVFGYTYMENEESDHVALDLVIRKKYEGYKVAQ